MLCKRRWRSLFSATPRCCCHHSSRQLSPQVHLAVANDVVSILAAHTVTALRPCEACLLTHVCCCRFCARCTTSTHPPQPSNQILLAENLLGCVLVTSRHAAVKHGGGSRILLDSCRRAPHPAADAAAAARAGVAQRQAQAHWQPHAACVAACAATLCPSRPRDLLSVTCLVVLSNPPPEMHNGGGSFLRGCWLCELLTRLQATITACRVSSRCITCCVGPAGSCW